MFSSSDRAQPGSGSRTGVQLPVYRAVNTQCRMDLSGDEMTAPVLRSLVRCFNAAGAMEKSAKLMESLSDQELGPIARWMGQELLSQPTRLYQLDESISILDKEQKWVQILHRLGKILENEGLVSSALSLLREGLAASQTPNGNRLLQALEKAAPEATDSRLIGLLDFAIPVGESRAIAALLEKINRTDLGSLTVPLAAQLSSAYLKHTRTQSEPQAGRSARQGIVSSLLARVEDQSLFEFVDAWLGSPSSSERGESERVQSARVAALFDRLFGQQARVASQLFPTVWAADRPMACFRETQAVPHLRDALVTEWTRRSTDESSRYMVRDAALELVLLQPYCSVPTALSQNFKSIQELALTPEWDVMSELLETASRVTRGEEKRQVLVDLFFQLMGDLNDQGAEGVLNTLPLLTEASERGLILEGLLAATAPTVKDRSGLARDLKFLNVKHRDLGGQSIVDVLTHAASFASAGDLADLYRALLQLARHPEPLIVDFMLGARDAYYSSNVHPGLDLVRSTLAKSTKNQDLMETLVKIASRSEFKEMLREVAVMARPEDGRLKDLVGGMLGVLRQYSRKGQVDVQPLVVSPLEVRRSHNFAGVDAPAFPSIRDRVSRFFTGITGTRAQLGACLEVDPQFVWDRYTVPGYRGKLENLIKCIEAEPASSDLAQALRFLADTATEGGRSFLELPLDWATATTLSREDVRYLSDHLLGALGERKVDRFASLLPLLVNREFAAKDGTRGTLVRPVMELVRPIFENSLSRAALTRTLNYSGTLMRMPEFQTAALVADQIWDQQLEPVLSADQDTPAAIRRNFDFERIKRWISNKECSTLPPVGTPEWERKRTERAENVVREYLFATQNEPLALEAGMTPIHWDRATLRARLQPLLERVRDPQTRGTFVRAFIQFARAFSRKEGEAPQQGKLFTQDELFEFLRSRSNDQALVTYFYKGETVPRVRLLSSMDRLEIMLESADIYPGADPNSEVKQNFGLSLIGNVLAKAWGSEPKELWPEIVKKEFPCVPSPRKKCPKTLVRAYNELTETTLALPSQVGLPDQPTCQQVANPLDPPAVQRAETTNPTFELEQPPVPCTESPAVCAQREIELAEVRRKAFNIGRVIDVLTENMPDSGHVHAGGMRILRHLMIDVLASSLPSHQNDEAIPGNNLVGVWELARAGGLRIVSELLYGVAPDDEVAKAFFRGLVSVAQSPQAEELLNALLLGADNEALVNTVYQVAFNFVEAARGAPTDAVRRQEWLAASPVEREVLQQQWKLELARLKQSAVYAVLLLPALGHSETFDLASKTLKTLAGMMGGENRSFWAAQGETIEKVLREPKVSWLVRALVSAVAHNDREALGRLVAEMSTDPARGQDLVTLIKQVKQDAHSSRNWDQLWDRVDQMTSSPEYSNLRLRELVSEVLGFVGGRSGRLESLSASRGLLNSFASYAERGDFEQVLWLMTQKPDQFERALKGLGLAVDRGSVGELLTLARTAFGRSQ